MVISLFVFPSEIVAQKQSNEQVKRLQRSIFVFNFAQQVGGWPNFDKLDEFTIGVLGPDRTVIDLMSLAQKRRIQGKQVDIVRYNLIKEIDNIQLLYVNNQYNYSIEYILNKIADKNILLVTEDYNYHASMINMINVGNSFKYEINEEVLRQEGFSITPSLSKYAVSSAEKWKELYRNVEKSLNNVKELEARQEQLLKDKEQQILTQEQIITQQKETIDTTLKTISKRDEWIEQLGTESELQQKKYEDKLLIERELEKNIQKQIEFIKSQESKIELSDEKIKQQEEYLEVKSLEVEEKEEVLKRKNSEISAHRRANILLIVIVLICILGVVYIYRSYLNKKRLNAILDEKNKAIEEQAALLESKNSKLEQFNYIATHDLKTPISNLEGYYSFLKEDIETEDAELLDTVHWIGKSIEQSKLMIDDLTLIAKSENSKMHYEECSFQEIIDSILENFDKEIIQSNAKIHINLKACSTIKYGKVELRSILQNLISNALKYKSPDRVPEIQISTSIERDTVLLSIKDNGLGIDLEKHFGDVFQAFKRIHVREEGSGIGLYIIKNLIESNGGKIDVTSKVNEGSAFTVYFKKD